MLAEHCDKGIYVGKINYDDQGNEYYTEFIPKKGQQFGKTKIIVANFEQNRGWILSDFIQFKVVRHNCGTRRPNIVIASGDYKEIFLNDYRDKL